ncbi:polyprenyl synthetase family protein [Corynebacterium amycolatum]|uniref:Polyprenyl synthetase family protein n=1 Tax=Corynebacterium amycolatum TaxID=43765 RepID=A0AB37GDD4_CORAY|nr:polyprenyl synthetase family protein [Corynebacterium amycolatum]QPR31416.1 polyprenyl synthetase family protein [Corynebacterium amycolatum]QQB83296.1 polyprenyl synthetase family protein [Corynebacterium amycolatum]QQV00863.1 polyprenyl synthetase family protein [Corynebacterium amycolatum]
MKVELDPGGFLATSSEELKNELSNINPKLEQSTAVQYALNPHGKLIRPLTLFAIANALGLSGSKALVTIAASIEKLHIATLVHDDIIDDDQWRRGRPSLHTQFDVGTAIVVGDSLIFETTAWVKDAVDLGINPRSALEILSQFTTAGQQLCSGQQLESRMTSSLSFSYTSYIRMVEGKTSALFELAAVCGAILANASEEEKQRFFTVGQKFGIAFQMQDDLLPFFSDREIAGKDLLSDLRNKRPSFPLVVAVELLKGANRTNLLSILDSETPAGADSFSMLTEIFVKAGVLQKCQDLLGQTLEEVNALLQPYRKTEGGEFLVQLLHQSARRNL